MKKFKKTLKIILLEDVPGIGRKGTVQDVATGYARNFLLKKNLANMATKVVLENLSVEKVKQTKKERNDLKEIQHTATIIDGAEIEMQAKANADGKLYAALSTKTIGKALKEHLQVTIQPKQIVCETPIKEIGQHSVRIEFGHGIEAALTIIVSHK